MKTEWSLDELYKDFKCEEFSRDLRDFEVEIKKLKEWCVDNLKDSENAVEKMENYIGVQNYMERFTKLYEYASLTLSVDSLNGEAAKALDVIEETAAGLKAPEVMFMEFIKGVENFDALIAGSKILREHEFFLKELKNKSRYFLSRQEEELIARLKMTGSGLWSKLHEQLTSTLSVDIELEDGKKSLPLAVVRNMAYDKNTVIRKKAYEAELEACEKIDKSIAFALNGIKGEVLTTTRERGYESVLDKTLKDSRMEMETLTAMFEAIRDFLPEFRRYFRKKAEMLGHKNGLPFYDLFAPVGEADMRFTYDEAAEFIIGNFTQFSQKLGDFAKRAFESRWIDALPRDGKRGGAFCANLHTLKQSRILANFEGSFNDVLTLAHELGHAYHGEQLIGESYVNSHYPMPIAETASTLCETVICSSALKTATREQAAIIRENDISGAAQVIVDIYSRFLFEDEVINRRRSGSLSVDELKEIMLDAQRKTYGDGLDSQFLHPYMWLVKPHYYYAEENYYNFPYAYGMMFSKGLYAKYLDSPAEFLNNYDLMLSATGRSSLREAALMMGEDVSKKRFWNRSLKMVAEEIENML